MSRFEYRSGDRLSWKVISKFSFALASKWVTAVAFQIISNSSLKELLIIEELIMCVLQKYILMLIVLFDIQDESVPTFCNPLPFERNERPWWVTFINTDVRISLLC
jgi:hypothetical protein